MPTGVPRLPISNTSMKPFSRFALLGSFGLLFASCGKPDDTGSADAKTPPAGYTTPGSSWAEPDFTAWMSRAELQYLQEKNPADQYFAHVEGRTHQGRIEYRAVVRPFSADQFDQWAVFWGINEAELFDWELRLLRTGFSRKDMQSFQDSTGKALYQIVWLKPKEQPGEQDNNTVAENVAAPQSVQPETESIYTPFQETIPAPAPVEPAVAKSEPPAHTGHVEEAPKPKPAPEPEPSPKSPRGGGKTITYVVQPGDTLGKIAKRKGTSVSDLKENNRLKSDILRIGQKLTISVRGE
jgi:LysM repeat protein